MFYKPFLYIIEHNNKTVKFLREVINWHSYKTRSKKERQSIYYALDYSFKNKDIITSMKETNTADTLDPLSYWAYRNSSSTIQANTAFINNNGEIVKYKKNAKRRLVVSTEKEKEFIKLKKIFTQDAFFVVNHGTKWEIIKQTKQLAGCNRIYILQHRSTVHKRRN